LQISRNIILEIVRYQHDLIMILYLSILILGILYQISYFLGCT